MIKNSKRFSAVIAVFLITSLMTTMFLSGTTVRAAVFGSKYFYLYLEKDNLKELQKKYREYYKERYLNESSYECKANAKLDGDFIKYDEEMKTIADYLSRFEFNVKYNLNNKDLDNSYYSLFLGAKYDNKDFVDMDIKAADQKALISFPSLTEKVLGIDNTSTYKLSDKYVKAFLEDDKAFEELFGVSRDTYDDILQGYFKDAIFDQIPDSKVVFSSDAKFEDINCNSITFNIDKEVVSNIYKAMAAKLEDDKNIRTICNSFINSYIELANIEGQDIDFEKPTPEKIDEEIKSLCESLNEEAANLEDIQLTYTAYYKSNGDIISRQFSEKESETDVIFSTYKDSLGYDKLSFIVKDKEDNIFEIKNKMILLNGMYNGECMLDISGKNFFKADYTYEKDAKVGNLSAFVGNIKGKISLDQLKEETEFNSPDSAINDIYFSVSNSRKDNNTLQGKSAFTFNVGGKRMGVSVFTEVKQMNVSNITKPNISLDNAISIYDEEGMEEFANDISERMQEKIMGLLLSGSIEKIKY